MRNETYKVSWDIPSGYYIVVNATGGIVGKFQKESHALDECYRLQQLSLRSASSASLTGSGPKFEPSLQDLATDKEQRERVRELLLDADTWEEMCVAFDRFGVTKPLYFLQSFARDSDTLK